MDRRGCRGTAELPIMLQRETRVSCREYDRIPKKRAARRSKVAPRIALFVLDRNRSVGDFLFPRKGEAMFLLTKRWQEPSETAL